MPTVLITEFPASSPDKGNNEQTRTNQWLGSATTSSWHVSCGQLDGSNKVWLKYFDRVGGRLTTPKVRSLKSRDEAIAFINALPEQDYPVTSH